MVKSQNGDIREIGSRGGFLGRSCFCPDHVKRWFSLKKLPIGRRFSPIKRWFLPGSYQEVVSSEEVAHGEEIWPL